MGEPKEKAYGLNDNLPKDAQLNYFLTPNFIYGYTTVVL